MSASNAAGIAALDAAIAKISKLGAAPREIAPLVAKEMKTIVDNNIAAGRAPDGTAWKPTKKGEKPLAGAAAAVSALASGSRVVLTVSGPEAFHHMGRTRGGVSRPILPGKRLPDPWVEGIRRATKRWTEGL